MERKVTSRSVSVAAVFAVALSMPGMAQTQDPVLSIPEMVDQESDPAMEALKAQVKIHESMITGAVREGGRRLAERTRQIVPDVELQMSGLPIVNSVFVPDVGFYFDVQVPNVLETGIRLLELYMAPNSPLRSSRPRTVGNAVPTPTAADLMDFDVGREYGTYVRDALVDMMLTTTLPMQPAERLIVIARVPQQGNALALADEGRKLVLTLLGSDLDALRSGAITADEAKLRITEFRF